ncbi:uncharacterized protein EV420DRAFT_180637 [Desarmillaria tabescens]|uniref:BAG domain-containing protein n=1 Tax=Armillaria tabescens TaxID=1929756 RepID=A0AA39T365_ARMTA|nr:uncharacterized protein EV420DRAFT_180637 [Desarmillaria tabescens]KAK0461126.1 hypothetical protein EV420DRAFT_180637 [Desarmillaria tabescens]
MQIMPLRPPTPLVLKAQFPEAPPRPNDTHPPLPTEQSLDEPSRESNEVDLVQKSLDTIETIQKRFEGLKTTFAWPSHLDFELDGEVVSVSTNGSSEPKLTPPKLAYTNRNTPLHAYNEALNRLLVQLDAVESWGELEIRERRKCVVSMVEAEAARVERGWKAMWEAGKDDIQDDEGYGGEEQQ